MSSYPVEYGYLFGSLAAGNAIASSDVDIAVSFSRRLSRQRQEKLKFQLITDLERTTGRQVDLVVLNSLQNLLLKFTIISEGKLVYSRFEDLRVDFENRVMREYFDFKPFLDEYNKAYVARNC